MKSPVKAILETEELLQHLHPALLYIDYENYRTKFIIMAAAIAIFSAIFYMSSIIFSRTRKYCSLRDKEKMFWNLAIVRACFGIFGSIIGAWCIFTYNNHDRDPVFGQTATSSFAMNATIGFFLFECLALTASDIKFGTFSRLLHLHHWFCVMGGATISFSEAGYNLGVISLALEMSTPFSAICWILLKMDMGKTKLWTVNQMILLHTFHLRSIVECYEWWLTYKEWTVIWTTMPCVTFLTSYAVLCMFTFIATPYWAYRKTLQLFQPTDWNFEAAERNGQMNGSAHKVE